MKMILLATFVTVFAGSAYAEDLYNQDLTEKIYNKYVDTFSKLEGISSAAVTACIAGIPVGLHSKSAPDILPEACIQITFADKASLKKARAQYGQSFRIEEVLVYVGDISNSSPQPGISVHN